MYNERFTIYYNMQRMLLFSSRLQS